MASILRLEGEWYIIIQLFCHYKSSWHYGAHQLSSVLTPYEAPCWQVICSRLWCKASSHVLPSMATWHWFLMH